jgi:beta-1,2-N-acetylglucosaminyltransferase
MNWDSITVVSLKRLGRQNWGWIKIFLLITLGVGLFQLLLPSQKQKTIVIKKWVDSEEGGEDVQSEMHPRRLKAVGSSSDGNSSESPETRQNNPSLRVTAPSEKVRKTTESFLDFHNEDESQTEQYFRELIPIPKFKVKIVSGKTIAEVYTNGKRVYFSGPDEKARGIHVIVLNQASGAFITAQVFDTYLTPGEHALANYIDSIVPGRLVCVAIKDEGTFHLLSTGRKALKNLGSELVGSIEWRSTFVMVAKKGGELIDEEWRKAPDVHSWAADIALVTTIEATYPAPLCDWTKKPENKRRTRFCTLFDGFPELCNCNSTAKTGIVSPPLSVNNIADVPVLILGTNDSHLLLKALENVASVAGSRSLQMVASTMNQTNEMEALTHIFGVRLLPVSVDANTTSAKFYRNSIAALFKMFPAARFTIILEVNAKLSVDVFDYFSQTFHILKEDPSVYCISAWNYMGYKHVSTDSSIIYRAETPPGVAWMVNRETFEDVIFPKWPESDSELFSFMSWIGPKGITNERECIVPEVSRAVLSSPSQFWHTTNAEDELMESHVLNSRTGVQLKDTNRMHLKNYDLLIDSLLKSSSPVDHSLLPTDPNFIPFSRVRTYTHPIVVCTYIPL